jgi:hypothetical protein
MKTLEQIEIMFENKKEWRGGERAWGNVHAASNCHHFLEPRRALVGLCVTAVFFCTKT